MSRGDVVAMEEIRTADTIDWRAEAEAYCAKCEQLQAELAAAKAKLAVLEGAKGQP